MAKRREPRRISQLASPRSYPKTNQQSPPKNKCRSEKILHPSDSGIWKGGRGGKGLSERKCARKGWLAHNCDEKEEDASKSGVEKGREGERHRTPADGKFLGKGVGEKGGHDEEPAW